MFIHSLSLSPPPPHAHSQWLLLFFQAWEWETGPKCSVLVATASLVWFSCSSLTSLCTVCLFNSLFWKNYRLTRTCRNSTERLCAPPPPQLPPKITSCKGKSIKIRKFTLVSYYWLDYRPYWEYISFQVLIFFFNIVLQNSIIFVDSHEIPTTTKIWMVPSLCKLLIKPFSNYPV